MYTFDETGNSFPHNLPILAQSDFVLEVIIALTV